MRKFIICVLLLATAFNSFAQITQKGAKQDFIFSEYTVQKSTYGGNYSLPCSKDYAEIVYTDFMKNLRLKTKKVGATEFTTIGMGGVVTATITGTKEQAFVEILVKDATFQNLTEQLRLLTMSKMNADSLSKQTDKLKSMENRLLKIEKKNIDIEEDVKKLFAKIAKAKADIAQNMAMHLKNEGYIQQYKDSLIPQQKSIVNYYNEKLKEINDELDSLSNLPTK